MDFIRSQLEQEYNSSKKNSDEKSSTKLVIYIAKSFEFYYTYDGIDICGTRVANEVTREIERLNNLSEENDNTTNEKNETNNGKVVKISVVGYSLGGLIARYTIGLLEERGLFKTIKPVVFTTFATPHVGVLALSTGPMARMYNKLGPYVLSYTSRQLFLTDKFPLLSPSPSSASLNSEQLALTKKQNNNNGKPLLECLADPSLKFYRGLSRFETLAVYGNIVNDHRTEWYTTAISTTDPFTRNANSIRGHYYPGYGPIVLDITKPLEVLTHPSEGSYSLQGGSDFNSLTKSSSSTDINKTVDNDGDDINAVLYLKNLAIVVRDWTKSHIKRIGRIFVALSKVIILPAWFVAFLINVGCQTTLSFFRKQTFVRSEVFHSFNSFQNLSEYNSDNNKVHVSKPNNGVSFSIGGDETPDDDQFDSLDGGKKSSTFDSNQTGTGKYQNRHNINQNNDDDDDGYDNNIFSSPNFNKLQEETQGVIDSVMGAVNYESQINITKLNENGGVHYTTYNPDDDERNDDTTTSDPSRPLLSSTNLSSTDFSSPENTKDNDQILLLTKEHITKSFSLESSMNSSQLAIISNLNKLPFKKFPVHITKTKLTHAAMIVRYPDDSFIEGSTVVKHWCKEIFQF